MTDSNLNYTFSIQLSSDECLEDIQLWSRSKTPVNATHHAQLVCAIDLSQLPYWCQTTAYTVHSRLSKTQDYFQKLQTTILLSIPVSDDYSKLGYWAMYVANHKAHAVELDFQVLELLKLDCKPGHWVVPPQTQKAREKSLSVVAKSSTVAAVTSGRVKLAPTPALTPSVAPTMGVYTELEVTNAGPPSVVSGTEGLTAKEKDALQHTILAALRLRGYSISTHKEVYNHTYTAAKFALVQQKNRQKTGRRITIVEIQEKIEVLLNLFLPED